MPAGGVGWAQSCQPAKTPSTVLAATAAIVPALQRSRSCRAAPMHVAAWILITAKYAMSRHAAGSSTSATETAATTHISTFFSPLWPSLWLVLAFVSFAGAGATSTQRLGFKQLQHRRQGSRLKVKQHHRELRNVRPLCKVLREFEWRSATRTGKACISQFRIFSPYTLR